MDLYHKVLLKLYEETDGNEALAVNFVDLVKRQGFYGNYKSIFQELSGQAWILETSKADWVKITHWGVKEAKKSQLASSDGARDVGRELNRLITETRDLLGLLEDLARENSKENYTRVEKKASELSESIDKLKSDF